MKFEKLEREQGAKFGEYFTLVFDNEVEEMKKFTGRGTGFKNIDKQQILFPCLIIVGGVPSIGKTSFLWQTAEQIAMTGETCVYCSYEMSQLELFSKSVSREIYKRDKHSQISAAQIA